MAHLAALARQLARYTAEASIAKKTIPVHIEPLVYGRSDRNVKKKTTLLLSPLDAC
jgi:hypothetical protein